MDRRERRAPAASPPSSRPAARRPADPRPGFRASRPWARRRRSRSGVLGLAAGAGGDQRDQGKGGKSAHRRAFHGWFRGRTLPPPHCSRKPARGRTCILRPSCCSAQANWAANSPSPRSGSAAESSPATATTMRPAMQLADEREVFSMLDGVGASRRGREASARLYRPGDRGDRHGDAGRAGARRLAHRSLGQGGAADHEPRRHPRFRGQGAGAHHLALPVRRNARRGDRCRRDRRPARRGQAGHVVERQGPERRHGPRKSWAPRSTMPSPTCAATGRG